MIYQKKFILFQTKKLTKKLSLTHLINQKNTD
jgi:hypothetical protein